MNAELYNLADRMAAGVITPAQRDRLETLLRDDAEAQRRYVIYLDLHAQLHWNLRGPAAERIHDTPASPGPMASLRTVGVSLAASAMIALALIAWFVSSPEPRTPSPEPSAVAMLSNLSEDAVFTESSASMRLGAELDPGSIHLTAGSAQVMFKSGAVVDLTGPCVFEMTGPNRGYLHRGRLEAFVRAEARGFTVASPVGVVTDLGTAFDFTCQPQSKSTLKVIEGRVTFEPIGMPPVTMRADDELRLSVDPESLRTRRLTLTRAPAEFGVLVGQAQANGRLGYQSRADSAIVGVGGSTVTRSRQASNVILEFDLPAIDLPLIQAELAVTKSEQNILHNHPLAVVLSAVDPVATLDASLYTEGPVVESATTAVITDRLLSGDDPAGDTVRLSLLDTLGAPPAGSSVLRLRLSPDRPANLQTVHRINIDAASARLMLVFESPVIPGPTERD